MKLQLTILSLTLAAASSLVFSAPAHAVEPAYVANENDDVLVGSIEAILETVAELEQYVSLEENARYLRPIKVQGGKCQATIYGHGGHSARAIVAAQTLIAQVRAAKLFIERRYAIDATFRLAVTLESQAEWLDDLID